MDHKMSNDLPLTFEEQLQRDCPALFQINESPMVASGVMRPDFEPGNEPGDEAGNRFLTQPRSASAPAPRPQNPAMAMRAQQGGNRGLGGKVMELQAARRIRQQIAADLDGFGLDELNQIAKQVRYLKLSVQGRQQSAATQRQQLGV